MKIDDKDFAILKILESSGSPLWKKEIHRRLDKNIENIPLESTFSVQTVGRRVDRMVNEGILESFYIKTDEVNRMLIKSFYPTEMGLDKLVDKREKFMEKWLKGTLLEDKTRDFEEQVLNEVFANLYSVPKKICCKYSRDYMKKMFFLDYYRNFSYIMADEKFHEFSEKIFQHNPELEEQIGDIIPER